MLIHGDTFDAVPTSTPGTTSTIGLRPLTPEARRWTGLYLDSSQGTFSGLYPSSGDQWIETGILSEHMLKMRAWANIAGASSWSTNSLYRPTINATSKHVIGAAFSWQVPTNGSAAYPRPVFAWNAGLHYAASSDVPLVYWANTALLLVDGRLQLAGVQATMPITQDSFVFIELELNPTTSSASAYVNDILVLENVPILGLTSVADLGICIGFPKDATRADHEANATYSLDNIYMLDGTGTTFNQRLGPVSFRRLPLNATQVANFVPINASTNLAAVAKTDLGTASYNRAPDINDVGDLFTLDTSSLVDDTAILGIFPNYYTKQETSTGRTISATVKYGEETAMEQVIPRDSLEFTGTGNPLLFPTAPDSTVWTKEKLNSTSVGYTVRELPPEV